MSATIPSLWPEDIKVDVLPPLTILKIQADKIRELTKGILHGEVTTVTGSEDFVAHRLDLIAPALDGRRFRVLTATHRTDFYPIVIEAETFKPKSRLPRLPVGSFVVRPTWPEPDDWRPAASDQEEFLKRTGEVLRSPEVRSAIDTMIALSNEKGQPTNGDATA